MVERYWLTNDDEPFATLLRIIDTHCHPEAHEEAYDELIELAGDPEVAEMRVFKDELQQALRDPSQLPKGALGKAAQYDDGSDEAFLRRLWRDLYGDEPWA